MKEYLCSEQNYLESIKKIAVISDSADLIAQYNKDRYHTIKVED